MKKDKRSLILDTAEKLMIENKKNIISTSMIAEAAGIAKGGIYYYFEKKEDILYAVIQRYYRRSIDEFLSLEKNYFTGIEKIAALFKIAIHNEFDNQQNNLIQTIHRNDDTLIHNYLKLVAIQEMSPVLERILIQCVEERSININVSASDTSEMIVAVLTFILDGTIFDEEKLYDKLDMFSKILDTCLGAKPGTFRFVYDLWKK